VEGAVMKVKSLNKDAITKMVSQIEDGTIFESFAQEFLAALLGHEFQPAGHIHDKGIDGYFIQTAQTATIYQIAKSSTKSNHWHKISTTIDKLVNNGIVYKRLIYVCSNDISDKKTLLEDKAFKEKNTHLTVYDSNWFGVNGNNSPAVFGVIERFIDQYVHELKKPGSSFVVSDLQSDPRIYVFLSQQKHAEAISNMDQLLADSLILLALEDTDPDEDLLKNEDEIFLTISSKLKFDPCSIKPAIKERLQKLSAKPLRKIKYHGAEKAYCLSYEERKAITERNIRDRYIESHFYEAIKDYVREIDAEESNCDLVSQTAQLARLSLHRLFSEKGLEFLNFILGKNETSFQEKDLSKIIIDTAEEHVVCEYRNLVSHVTLGALRSAFYNGDQEQIEYLTKLADSYSMMFILQCDPKLSTYFTALAGQIEALVDTSIIIPALTEKFLPKINQRYSQFLKKCREKGVKMYATSAVISEIKDHFESSDYSYYSDYERMEDMYEIEGALISIPKISIRAYYHAKIAKKINSWRSYINAFVSPDDRDGWSSEIISYLSTEFGIDYVEDKHFCNSIDSNEISEIAKSIETRLLGKFQRNESQIKHKASNDAKMIHMVYQRRSDNNENSSNGIFGFKTWWLSTDHKSLEAARSLLPEKFANSCYMRPDFLYNFIALAPTQNEAQQSFEALFPTFLGVNISFRVPKEVFETIKGFLQEHTGYSESRKIALMKRACDKVRSDPSYHARNKLRPYLDEIGSSTFYRDTENNEDLKNTVL
jgi:hypothetical protein